VDFSLSRSEIRLLARLVLGPITVKRAGEELKWPASHAYTTAKKLVEKGFLEQPKRHQPLRVVLSCQAFAFQKLLHQHGAKTLEDLLSGATLEILLPLTLKDRFMDAKNIHEWTGISLPAIYKHLNPLQELGWVKKTTVYGAKDNAAYGLGNPDLLELVEGLQTWFLTKILWQRNAGSATCLANKILFYSNTAQTSAPTGLNALRRQGYVDYLGETEEYFETIGKKRKIALTLEDYVIHALVLSDVYAATQKNATYVAWLLAGTSRSLPGFSRKKPLKINWRLLREKAVQYGVGQKLEGIVSAIKILEGENKQ